MGDVKWIKLSVGLPDNKKLKQIRTLPQGDSIALMWVFLLCLAGDVNEEGVIYLTPEIPYTDEMLAEEFKMDVNIIRIGLKTFQNFGMLEIVDDIIKLNSWEKWQSTDRLAEIREYNRLAKQKSREKQKQLKGVNDKSMTSQRCQDTDIEIEEEEKKKKNNNNKKATAFDDAINSYTDYEPLKNAIYEFIKMRKTIKAPLTDHALKLMLNRLNKLSASDDVKVLILNQSITGCWKGIYELKEDYKGGGNNGFNKNENGKADADSKFADWQPSGGVL